MARDYEKLTDPNAKKKFAKVMREYYAGRLRSGGSGRRVARPSQAKAIAYSEARKASRKG